MKFTVMRYAIATILTLFALSCGGGSSSDDEPIRGDDIYTANGISPTHRRPTPRGATMTAKHDEDFTPGIATPIDEGLADLFAVVTQPPYNYTKAIIHASYNVHLMPDETRNMCDNPAFLGAADGSAWDQTEWDKDRRPFRVLLCIAGLWFNSEYIVIVNSVAQARNVTRYEGEHMVAFHNNPILFAETQNVHAHPIFPDPGERQHLKDESWSKLKAGGLDKQTALVTK